MRDEVRHSPAVGTARAVLAVVAILTVGAADCTGDPDHGAARGEAGRTP
ncbi:hypothetical protein [Streptomyces sp. NPDC057438]